jgi:hypothetical protein
MVARDVELLGRQLHELNERTVEELGLAAVAFALALGATQMRRDLAIPLLVGALALTGMGLVAFVRRRLLVEDAAADRDAYELAEVRRYAAWIARREQRLAHAAQIRRLLTLSPEYTPARIEVGRAELEELEEKLKRVGLPLDPACAVALERLLHEETIAANEFRSRLRQVLAGFGDVKVNV